MDWRKRSRRRPVFNDAGHAHELTFSCYRDIIEPKTLLAMIEYIHANPVRRGLVKHAEDWKWSSAGWREGKKPLGTDPLDFGGLCLFLGGKD